MADISDVIAAKSDQYNADDLRDRQLTVTFEAIRLVGGQEQPVTIKLVDHDKYYRPGKSMCRAMAMAWGPDTQKWVGKSVTLYCDPTVKFGSLLVGGIRISHMSDIDGPMTMALTATKGVKKGFTVKPLVREQKRQDPPAAEQQQQRRQTAPEWAAAHVARLLAAPDMPTLEAIITKAKTVVNSLAQYPDLPKLVSDAEAKRKAELAPPAADAPFDPGTGEFDPNPADPFGLPPLPEQAAA